MKIRLLKKIEWEWSYDGVYVHCVCSCSLCPLLRDSSPDCFYQVCEWRALILLLLSFPYLTFLPPPPTFPVVFLLFCSLSSVLWLTEVWIHLFIHSAILWENIWEPDHIWFISSLYFYSFAKVFLAFKTFLSLYLNPHPSSVLHREIFFPFDEKKEYLVFF